MPNIKSAKKRVLVINKKTAQNRMVKSALKTALKKFDAAVEAGDAAAANELYPATISAIDSSCTKGVIHKNKANHAKAQVSRKLNTVSAE